MSNNNNIKKMASNSEPTPNVPDNDPPSIGSEATSPDSDDVRITRFKSRKNITPPVCTKLMLPKHLAAHMEGRELERNIDPVECNQDILDTVFGNYYIVKNILRNLHWHDKLMCKEVCMLWDSAVKRLQLEQLAPVHFSIKKIGTSEEIVLVKSSEFYSTPMAVFTFCTGVRIYERLPGCYTECRNTIPRPCSPPCDFKHSILDVIHHETTAPEDCMYAVTSYKEPTTVLTPSISFDKLVEEALQTNAAAYNGIFIPQVPDVKFVIVNTTTNVTRILEELQPLAEKYTIKGVIACLKNTALTMRNAKCLEILDSIQPDTPFAFCGSICEETANNTADLITISDCLTKGKNLYRKKKLSLGIFMTPKINSTSNDPRYIFETYSCVIDLTDWTDSNTDEAIQKFSKRVPCFEHSVAIKFSCLQRQPQHKSELLSFETFFPNTRIVGCFSNGVLGVNHPPTALPSENKRPRSVPAYGSLNIIYTTVFFLIGWGKISKERQWNK